MFVLFQQHEYSMYNMHGPRKVEAVKMKIADTVIKPKFTRHLN